MGPRADAGREGTPMLTAVTAGSQARAGAA
jgi:hypothetical protein